MSASGEEHSGSREDRVTVICAGWLVDGTGGPPVADAALAVRGSLIAWSGPHSGLPDEYRNVGVIDFGEATMTPGLIDCHAHFSLFADGRTYEEMADDSDLLMVAAAARNLRIHLAAGVTTARDNGARAGVMLGVREAQRRGLLAGPRLLVSDAPVTVPGGHFHWCHGEASGVDEVAARVDDLVACGVDHIKVMASGGDTLGTDPTEASYSEPELAAAVRSAHTAAKLVAAHCRATESMTRAIAAGVDCIEHGEFLEPDRALRFDSAVASRLVASTSYLSPVLQASGWDTLQRLRRAEKLWGGLTEEERRLRAQLENETAARLEHVQELRRRGMAGRIVGGTDAGCYDVSFGHMDYCAELFVAAGMSELEAIHSMTGAAAAACGIERDLGTLEPRKIADIAVFSGHVLEDVTSLSRPEAVYQAGELVAGSSPPAA